MKHFLSLISLFILLILPACSRFADWSSEHVEQGFVRSVPKDLVRSYVRTERIYNQFNTVGIFHALWLSDDVRQAYVDVHAAKFSLSREEKENLLGRQLAENDNFICFYFFSFIPGSNLSLTDKNSIWKIRLKVNGKLYDPMIETSELLPEYAIFLKRIVSNHQDMYLLKFPRKDDKGKSIINSRTRMLELHLSTVDRSTSLIWHLDKNQHLAMKHKEE